MLTSITDAPVIKGSIADTVTRGDDETRVPATRRGKLSASRKGKEDRLSRSAFLESSSGS